MMHPISNITFSWFSFMVNLIWFFSVKIKLFNILREKNHKMKRRIITLMTFLRKANFLPFSLPIALWSAVLVYVNRFKLYFLIVFPFKTQRSGGSLTDGDAGQITKLWHVEWICYSPDEQIGRFLNIGRDVEAFKCIVELWNDVWKINFIILKFLLQRLMNSVEILRRKIHRLIKMSHYSLHS